MTSPIRLAKTEAGIAIVTFDAPDSDVNILDDAMAAAFADCVARIERDRDQIKGVILTSAKPGFFHGRDLKPLYEGQADDAPRLFEAAQQDKRTLRRLETLGMPVVAALGGSALGAGFEIALGCHRRIAVDGAGVQLGFPDIKLGLIPGLGGIARTTRLIGLIASQPYLQDGKLVTPREALAAGLVDDLVNSPADLMARATDWIRDNQDAAQPWDAPGFVPPAALKAKAWLAGGAAAEARAKTRGNYPAPEAVLFASSEGLQVDFATACTIESRYFVGIVTGQVAKNILGTFWIEANEIRSGKRRPGGVEKRPADILGVLGAGMMGKDIAYVAATSGLTVLVKDVDRQTTETVIGHADNLLAKREKRGDIDAGQRRETLARIRVCDSYEDLAGADALIEAVPERPALKAEILAAAEPVLSEKAFWASNTSTLPITGLAAASARPERFIGLHFFSPAHRMELVEVITGDKTSQETLAHALDLVVQLGKTPIVVNDSRGFFTSRVFSTFTREGVAMVGEGQNPAAIETAAAFAGFPAGPLAVLDEVSLALSFNNRKETLKAFASEGRPLPHHLADDVMTRMLDEFGRAGRAAGGGFYDYPADGAKRLWPGLKANFGRGDAAIPQQDMRDRLLFCMAIESVRVLEEGVLRNAGDGNIGSVLGIGFPRWTGGVFQFLNQYGLSAAVSRARELAERYDARFAPPALLVEKAERGESF